MKLRDNVFFSKPKIVMNLLNVSDDVDTVVDGVYQSIDLMKAKALLCHNVTLDTTPVVGCENITFNTNNYWKYALSRIGGPAEQPGRHLLDGS